MMKTLGIIPARFSSTRFPGKPLVEIKGKSMIRRVVEQTQKAKYIDEVIVATDDDRIYQHVQQFGGRVEMTSTSHTTGTDRCAEVARRHREFEIVINIQGDEPFINPDQIDQVIHPLLFEEAQAKISTLAKQITDEKELFNPNVVKVVFNQQMKAMYFSRHSIPFIRQLPKPEWISQSLFFKHIGLYGFYPGYFIANYSASEGKV